MFKIEELLNLFKNNEIKNIILSTYLFSQSQNKELSDDVFQQLFFLKSLYPNICIEVNYQVNDTSNYNYMTNTINLNGTFDITTFFHELTHLFSFHYAKFVIPKEYYDFKSMFLSSDEFDSLVVLFLDLCKKEKQRILESQFSLEAQDNVNKDLNNRLIETNCEYSIICKLEDIIDSIYSGKSHTSGLAYLKDNNNLPKKASKSAGHGCEYFNKTGYEFEEIIADYQAIKLIAPDNQLFMYLQQILGNDFISFLDNTCLLINGQSIINERSNNINKK